VKERMPVIPSVQTVTVQEFTCAREISHSGAGETRYVADFAPKYVGATSMLDTLRRRR